ncbi:MAG TPA: hypothetical protein VK869_14755 [Rubrobacteraceae bacterium]|nr:hypothetical protein [Rubrobacteraceae bacterium]
MVGTVESSGSCQVRSGTDLPCGRPASVRLLGVLFCEECAREQDAYFAIGELTQTRDPLEEIFGLHGSYRDGPLIEALRKLRRGTAGGAEIRGSTRQGSPV